jgi:hypothetical protein
VGRISHVAVLDDQVVYIEDNKVFRLRFVDHWKDSISWLQISRAEMYQADRLLATPK